MICPHCIAHIHYSPGKSRITYDDYRDYFIVYNNCPNCNETFLYLNMVNKDSDEMQEILIFPKIPNRSKIDKNDIPLNIYSDYHEACLVISDSPKASAALSRRCLQNIIHDYFNIREKNLNLEIDKLLTIGLPSHISENVDAIRQIGNYAAHPMKYQQSGEIVDVEPGEAEWSLEVIEMLFDYCYVQPKKSEERREKMNEKLESLGKPKLK